MTRTRRSLVLVLLAVLTAAPVAAAPDDLVTLVPEDAHLLLMAEDAGALIEGFTEGPWGRLWNDPRMKNFLGPLRESMEIDFWSEDFVEETGFELEDVLAQLQGQVLFSLVDLSLVDEGTGFQLFASDPVRALEFEAGTDDFMDFPFLMLAHVGDDVGILEELWDQDLQSMREEAAEGLTIEESVVEYGGVTMHHRAVASQDTTLELESWAVVDGVMIVANPPAAVERIVDELADGGDDGDLRESAAWSQMRSEVPDSDLIALVNGEAMMAKLMAEFAAEASVDDEWDPRDFMAMLGMDQLTGAYLCLDETDETLVLDFGVSLASASGLLGNLPLGEAPAPMPAFVPDDVLSAGTARGSFDEAYEVLQSAMSQFDPMFAAMPDYYLAEMATNTGVDVRHDILGNLSGVSVGLTHAREGEQDDLYESAYVFDLQDPQAFGTALSGVLTAMTGGMELFTTRDYLGVELNIMKEPMPTDDPTQPGEILSYGIADGRFLLGMGSERALHRTIGALQDPGRSLWQREDVAAALAALPPAASQVLYFDLAQSLHSVFATWRSVPDFSGDAGGGLDDYVDREHLPERDFLDEFFGPLVGGIWRAESGLRVQLRLEKVTP